MSTPRQTKNAVPAWKLAQRQAQQQAKPPTPKAQRPSPKAQRPLPTPPSLSLLNPAVHVGKMKGVCRNILRHNQKDHWMVTPDMINFFQAPQFFIVGVDTDIQSPAHKIQRWFRARRIYHSLVGSEMTFTSACYDLPRRANLTDYDHNQVAQASVVIASPPEEALVRAKVALSMRARSLWIQPHASTKEVLSWVNQLSPDVRSRVICQADLLVRGHAALVLAQQWFAAHDRDPSERKLLPMN